MTLERDGRPVSKQDLEAERSKDRRDREEMKPDAIGRIHQAIGEASVAWENIDQAGVFRADLATKAAQSLIDDLREMGVNL